MLVTVLVVFLIIIILLFGIYLFDRNELDVLPGPSRLALFLLLVRIKPDNLFPTIREFRRQYGDRFIFKLFERKRVLHLSRQEDVEIVLTSTNNIAKSLPYEFVRPWLGTGLLLNTGLSWHKRRKILTPTFHFNILKNFAAVMEEKSRDLVQRLKRLDYGADVDLAPVMSDFTLFTICETAMGIQLDLDKSADTIQYKGAIQKIGCVLLDRLVKIWLHSDYIFNLTGGKQFKNYLNIVLSFADRVIIEKMKKSTEEAANVKLTDEKRVIVGPEKATRILEKVSGLRGEDVGIKKRMALLDLLLEAECRGQIDLTEIRDEVNTFMFAGHDTTAMTLTFCFMLLADHDDIQDRINEESTKILGSSTKSPTVSDLAEMKYLEAVIKETMRLYPSVPFIGRDITEDFMLGDILVKKGTEVSVHIFELHHRADIYPDPDKFLPERFLNGESRHPYAYIPFSAGPRNCIGQKFAMQEMKLVITEVCRNFRLLPKEKGVTPTLKCDIILRPVKPIYVKFIPRNYGK